MPPSDSEDEKSAVSEESPEETEKTALQEIPHNDPESEVQTKSEIAEADNFNIISETGPDKSESMPPSDSEDEKSAVSEESPEETEKTALQEIPHNDPESEVQTKSEIAEADNFNIISGTEPDKSESIPLSDSEDEKSAVSEESLEKTKKTTLKRIPHKDPELKVLPKSKVIETNTFNILAANRQIRIALDPLTVIGEQFRMLRTRLGLLQKEKGIKTVLITSSVPGEGKTFAACCLAGVFAQEPEKRVLLIDCDMRKPGSGSNIGVNGRYSNKGMSMLLRGELKFPDALLKAVGLEFFFVPNGPLPQNPTELLSSPILEQTIRSAAEDFDWVIIDSPPVLTLSDATLLAPLCDTGILVVRAGVTPSKLVKETVNLIGREKICGIVFNRRKQKYPDRYYYYYKKK